MTVRSGHPARSRAAAALEAPAHTAPSVVNTQPWRLTAETLELYADHSRALHFTDPSGRLLLLSCGAGGSATTTPRRGCSRRRVGRPPTSSGPTGRQRS